MTKYYCRDMLVEDAMTPADKIFMLSEDEHLNFEVSVMYSMHAYHQDHFIHLCRKSTINFLI